MQEVPYWIQVSESLAAVATPILIAIGGFFAWYKFFRQGEHDPSLQPAVAATAEIRGGGDKIVCVFATVTAQNSGQVEVELVPEGSALDVYTTSLKDEDWWRYPRPIAVFAGQKLVRPGETLEDQTLIQIEYSDEIAVRLDLTVTAKETQNEVRTWDTIEIVPLSFGESGQSEQSG